MDLKVESANIEEVGIITIGRRHFTICRVEYRDLTLLHAMNRCALYTSTEEQGYGFV